MFLIQQKYIKYKIFIFYSVNIFINIPEVFFDFLIIAFPWRTIRLIMYQQGAYPTQRNTMRVKNGSDI